MRATHDMLGVQPPSHDPEQDPRKYLGEVLATGIIVTSSTGLLLFILLIKGVPITLGGFVFISLYLGVVGGIQKTFLLKRPHKNDPGGSSGKELWKQFQGRTGLFFGILLVGFTASYSILELEEAIELPKYLLSSVCVSFIGALCFAAPSTWCRS